MSKELLFLEENEINEILSSDEEIIVWGCGPTSKQIIRTLCELDVKISFYGDSNPNLWGTYFNETRVLHFDELRDHINAVVIIASFGYGSINSMLINLGFHKIYALKDVYKYSLPLLLSDRAILKSYWNCDSYKQKDTILIELYGNIGDTIIRIGVVNRIISFYGKENVYILFSDSRNAELYKLVTDNILIIEETDLVEDFRRLEKLKEVNDLYFAKSFILCDVRIYAQRRILNSYNINIGEIIFDRKLPGSEYLVGRDAELVCNYLGILDKSSISAWNAFSRYIGNKNIVVEEKCKDGKYVAINIGASRRLRQYNPDRFRLVCRYIIEIGYELVILGYGEDDEISTNSLLEDYYIAEHSTNLVTELLITESAAIIKGASFFVGTDSGLWNLSYVLGIPSVVLYGGGEYGNFMHPDGLIEYVTVSDSECFGCKWYCNSTDDFGRAKCVYDITPDQIIHAIDKLINRMSNNREEQ